MNLFTCIGNLTSDPKMFKTEDKTLVSFCVAVNRRSKTDQQTDFFNVTAWEKLGELCMQHIKKGSKVCVTGRINITKYERDSVKQTAVNVIASDVEFLSRATNSMPESNLVADHGIKNQIGNQSGFDNVELPDLPF